MYNNNAIGTHGNVLNSLFTAGIILLYKYQSITVPTLHVTVNAIYIYGWLMAGITSCRNT